MNKIKHTYNIKKRIMNKTNKVWNKTSFVLFLLLLCTLIFVLTGCNKEYKIKNVNGIDVKSYIVHTNDQYNYLNGSYEGINLYAKGIDDLSAPNYVKIGIKSKIEGNLGLIVEELDDNNEKTGEIFKYETIKDSDLIDGYFPVYNLKLHTVYQYSFSNGESDYVYIDEEIVRNLYIDGVTNCRDIGGYKGKDGKYTNQGLIYRTSKLNVDEGSDKVITDKGIDMMLNQLRVKTEIDLRLNNNNENGNIIDSPLGNNVNYINLPMESSGNIILLNKNKFKDLFNILENKDNYPLFFHCSIGTDRTGCVAFILNVLLEVSYDDLYKDYLFSNFGNIGSLRTTNTLEKYYTVLDGYSGDNYKEKMISYLVSNGVNEDDINNFINIMTN